MKTERIAIFFLLLILAVCWGNTVILARLAGQVSEAAAVAAEAARDGDWDRADEAAEKAEAIWSRADAYTRSVLQHTDADRIAQVLHDLRAAAAGRNPMLTAQCAEYAGAVLEGLTRAERLSLESVF